MKFLLNTLLLLVCLNLIWARSIYQERYQTPVENPWSDYDCNDCLFPRTLRLSSDERKQLEKIVNIFDESLEPKTSDELIRDDVETLRAAQLKEIKSLIKAVFDENTNEDETDIENKSQENTKEIEDNKEDEEDDDDDKRKDGDDKKDDDDKGYNDNTAENDDDDTNNSPEQIAFKGKALSEEKKPSNKHEAKDSRESLISKNSDEVDALPGIPFSKENFEKHQSEISETDIKEFTALLMTKSSLEDLMKISVNSPENEQPLDTAEQNEKKLKKVNDYLSLFDSLFDEVLDESSENKNGKNHNTERVNKNNSENNDNDNKDDHHEDASVAFKFHDIDTFT